MKISTDISMPEITVRGKDSNILLRYNPSNKAIYIKEGWTNVGRPLIYNNPGHTDELIKMLELIKEAISREEARIQNSNSVDRMMREYN